MLKIRDKNIFRCYDNELGYDMVKEIDTLSKKCPRNSLVVNLENVFKIKKNNLDLLKQISEQNQLSLCSLEADIFAVINVLNYDGVFHIYPDEQSFCDDKFELKNRRFKIV